MSVDLRKVLLAAFLQKEGNDALRELLANGWIMFVLTRDAVEFKVTPTGRQQLLLSQVFEPENAS